MIDHRDTEGTEGEEWGGLTLATRVTLRVAVFAIVMYDFAIPACFST